MASYQEKSISSLTLTQNNIKVIIPKSAFDDLYEPDFSSVKVYSDTNHFYIFMDNSDGAGAYTIIWIFKDNKYYGRYIDDSEV